MITLETILKEYFSQRNDAGALFNIKKAADFLHFENFLQENGHIDSFDIKKIAESVDWDEDVDSKSEMEQPNEEPKDEEPTTDDARKLNILRKLGAEKGIPDNVLLSMINMDDDYKKSLIRKTALSTSGNKYGLIDSLTYNQMYEILKKEKNLLITYAGTIRKLRSPHGQRIAQWAPSNKVNDVNFNRVMLMYFFYVENIESIELLQRVAKGIGYETLQVENLNKWFINKNITTPMRLWMVDETKKLADMGVNVNSAEKIPGTGKADLGLMENSTPVFWISYKHGKYWQETQQTLANVPFQQYGSIKTLHKRLNDINSDKWISIIRDFSERLRGKLYSTQLSLGRGDENPFKIGKDRRMVSQIKMTDEQRELVRTHINTIDTIYKNKQNMGKEKVLYFTYSGFGVWVDLLDGSKEAEEIAGKTIYGLDFTLDRRTPFGPENVNCLIQTGDNLLVDLKQNDVGETDGIIIDTVQTGHILFNPNLPDVGMTDNPISRYRPVINARYTQAENWAWTRRGAIDIFLGVRILVMPKGNASGEQI